ncbi:MAG: metallopeptidase family protein [Patescibacteria group bacterium]|nr:metallopeptidase family protein [Patescibacteria group bacterium]
MTREEFEKLVEEEFPRAVPEKFHHLIKNVGFLVEDEPSLELRKQEGLSDNETLLGLYHGVPAVARGDFYGVGGTLPDTITLFQLPIEEEAKALSVRLNLTEEEALCRVIRETIWHEVAHYFGYDEHQVRDREDKRNEK